MPEEEKCRVLPHNLEAEQGLLGLLMLNNRQLDEISDFLRAEHFYQPPHQRIYDAILKLVHHGHNASPVTLKGYFENDEGLEPVGGARYLAELAGEVPQMNNAKDYADTIYELYLRRELALMGEDITRAAHEQSIDQNVSQTIEEIESRLFSLAETGTANNAAVSFQDSIVEAIELAERAYNAPGTVTGIPTAFHDLDHLLGGLQPSDLLILAARPSMGKTALATNIGLNAALQFLATNGQEGAKVGVMSLEMSRQQISTRMLSQLSQISSDTIRKGQITNEDFTQIVDAGQRHSKLPLYIDDTSGLTISTLRTRARRMKRQFGIDLLIVDYLQLLYGDSNRKTPENRTQEVSAITRGLKDIAKDLNIPVLALSQLSRNVENREDKRPQLADLRESGSIEQDADVVMFIYRHEYYLSREEPQKKSGEDDNNFNSRYAQWESALSECANVAEVIVAKQRHGPIGTVKLYFNPNLTKFADLDQQRLAA